MNQPNFQNNLGDSIVLNNANIVRNQYGQQGAEGDFAEVFDSAKANPQDTQIRCYNIVTTLNGYTPPGGTDGRVVILGKLYFGIGGVLCEVDFDWKNGNQISVAASFIRVTAAFSEVEAGSTPPQVKIGAMVSSGSRAARSQVTRSYPQLLVNDESLVIFPVPPFAHALNIFSADPEFYETGEVQIRYVGTASAGFSSASGGLVSFESDGAPFLTGLANEDGVRFPESTKFVEVSTATADQDYRITPCFTLNL